nr:PREDICTED: prosaposin-like [Paralichthys olivaceus]
MSPVFSIALLLLSAAVVESSVEQTEEDDFTSQLKLHVRKRATHHEEQILRNGAFPGSCRACTFVVTKVKKWLGKDSSKEKIDRLLNKACNGIKCKLIRQACNKIIGHFKRKLIDSIAHHENPKAICVKAKLCKK